MDNYPNIVSIILPSFRFKVFTLRRCFEQCPPDWTSLH